MKTLRDPEVDTEGTEDALKDPEVGTECTDKTLRDLESNINRKTN